MAGAIPNQFNNNKKAEGRLRTQHGIMTTEEGTDWGLNIYTNEGN